MVLEKTLESPLDCKEIQLVHPKGAQSRVFIGRTDAKVETLHVKLTHWKRPWCWDGLGAGGEGDDKGWDGWMASLTWWTWVWINSGSWWWTGRPGVLRFIGSQRVGHDWATELTDFTGKQLKVKQSEVTQSCLTLWPHGLQPTRLLHPSNFLSKSTGVGCHFLLQGIFLTQGSNPGLLHCR